MRIGYPLTRSVDSDGKVVEAYRYSDYGTQTAGPATQPSLASNPYRYTGEYTDAGTGHLYLRGNHSGP